MTRPVGLGDRFQPIPGAQIVRPDDGDGIARIPARLGTPVHAILTSIVVDVDGSGGIVLRGADGTEYAYSGLDPASLTVGAGTSVNAGDILGTVGASALELRIADDDGDALDAVEALLGLADPNELGYVPIGPGRDVDPDAMDREIVSSGLPGPA